MSPSCRAPRGGVTRRGSPGRRLDLSRGFELVLGHPVDNRTLDVLWALFSAEVYLKLRGIGWTRAEYQDFLLVTARRLLVE